MHTGHALQHRAARASNIVTLVPALLDLDTRLPELAAAIAATPPLPDAVPVTLNEAVAQRQREMIRQALAATANNWAMAARQLGLDASNLHKLARRLGLK